MDHSPQPSPTLLAMMTHALHAPPAARQVAVDQLVVAGWTGRDAAAVEHHIAELAALGVKPPRTTPIFYRVAASLLTTAAAIEVAGTASTGEVEAMVFSLADGLWVGVGSDHTDRVVETHGITWSKQICPKPVGRELWRWDDVAPHWDRLVLRSRVLQGGTWRLYQEGAVAGLRSPLALAELYHAGGLPPGHAMFCGTPAVIGGFAWADMFEAELDDPVLGRRLTHRYAMTALPLE